MIRGLDDLTRKMHGVLRDAYQRGWDDAMAAVLEAASSSKRNGKTNQAAQTTGSPQKPATHGLLSELNNRVTAREAVTQALEAKPGMQSGEIYQWTQVKGLSVTFEAVRTAIKRLRQKGAVVRYGTGYGLKPGQGE